MRIKLVSVVILLAVFSIIGCSQDLKRTSFEKWETKSFKTLGISLDIPRDKFRMDVGDTGIYQKNTNSKSLCLGLHPFFKLGMDERLYLLWVNIYILTESNYQRYKNNDHNVTVIDRSEFKNTDFFSEITEFEVKHASGAALRCFRKDFKNEKTGEVILAAITYMDNFQGNTEYRDKDIEAIKRILNSIKFIDGNVPLPAPDDKVK